MAEIDDRLVPEDGLRDFDISFVRMEAVENSGAAIFAFRITAPQQPSLEISVVVPSRLGHGLDQMLVHSHDEIIDVLRQLLFRADKKRSYFETRLAQLRQSANKPESAA